MHIGGSVVPAGGASMAHPMLAAALSGLDPTPTETMTVCAVVECRAECHAKCRVQAAKWTVWRIDTDVDLVLYICVWYYMCMVLYVLHCF